jgi:hypothetical protein
MADEALVLSAQVVDRFSAPIRYMHRQLRALVDRNAKAHTASHARVNGLNFRVVGPFEIWRCCSNIESPKLERSHEFQGGR